jgi:NADPH-dependent 2,4-dienoyl-CoA reductase/sulfur reductase-like enzyme
MRYLTVGAGAAGMSAAETIREIDPTGEILVYSAEPEGYYSRPALAYYLSREINKKSLFPRESADLLASRLTIRVGQITAILPDQKVVIDSANNRINYDKLLLATGAEAARPPIEGASLDGVVYLDSLAETEQIIRKSGRRKTAVVVGGGITALEIVEGLLSRKVRVHFLLRKEHYWGRVLDPSESGIILKRLEEEGVVIHRNTTLEKIIGKKGKVSGAVLSSGQTIGTDLVAFAIGVKPRRDLLETPGLKTQRGVLVNQYMQTSIKDIYAAGDTAEIYDQQTQSWVIDCLWPIARQQGAIAGKNMAGKKTPYLRRSPINVTRLSGLTTTIIGQVGSGDEDDEYSIVRGESESWQLMPDAVICQNDFEVNRLRLMVGREYLLGAVLMGDQSLSSILEELVVNQIPIGEIRDQLIEPGADLAGILVHFHEMRS